MLILTGQGTPRDDVASEEVALSVHIHAALALVTAEHCPSARTSVARILVNTSTFNVLFSSELFYFYNGAASLVTCHYLALEAVQTSLFGQSVPYIQTA